MILRQQQYYIGMVPFTVRAVGYLKKRIQKQFIFIHQDEA